MSAINLANLSVTLKLIDEASENMKKFDAGIDNITDSVKEMGDAAEKASEQISTITSIQPGGAYGIEGFQIYESAMNDLKQGIAGANISIEEFHGMVAEMGADLEGTAETVGTLDTRTRRFASGARLAGREIGRAALALTDLDNAGQAAASAVMNLTSGIGNSQLGLAAMNSSMTESIALFAGFTVGMGALQTSLNYALQVYQEFGTLMERGELTLLAVNRAILAHDQAMLNASETTRSTHRAWSQAFDSLRTQGDIVAQTAIDIMNAQENLDQVIGSLPARLDEVDAKFAAAREDLTSRLEASAIRLQQAEWQTAMTRETVATQALQKLADAEQQVLDVRERMITIGGDMQNTLWNIEEAEIALERIDLTRDQLSRRKWEIMHSTNLTMKERSEQLRAIELQERSLDVQEQRGIQRLENLRQAYEALMEEQEELPGTLQTAKDAFAAEQDVYEKYFGDLPTTAQDAFERMKALFEAGLTDWGMMMGQIYQVVKSQEDAGEEHEGLMEEQVQLEEDYEQAIVDAVDQYTADIEEAESALWEARRTRYEELEELGQMTEDWTANEVKWAKQRELADNAATLALNERNLAYAAFDRWLDEVGMKRAGREQMAGIPVIGTWAERLGLLPEVPSEQEVQAMMEELMPEAWRIESPEIVTAVEKVETAVKGLTPTQVTNITVPSVTIKEEMSFSDFCAMLDRAVREKASRQGLAPP